MYQIEDNTIGYGLSGSRRGTCDRPLSSGILTNLDIWKTSQVTYPFQLVIGSLNGNECYEIHVI
jgi:hypothetical protein